MSSLKSKGVLYSKERLIDKLSDIRDGYVLYENTQLHRVLEEMDEHLENLWNVTRFYLCECEHSESRKYGVKIPGDATKNDLEK